MWDKKSDVAIGAAYLIELSQPLPPWLREKASFSKSRAPDLCHNSSALVVTPYIFEWVPSPVPTRKVRFERKHRCPPRSRFDRRDLPPLGTPPFCGNTSQTNQILTTSFVRTLLDMSKMEHRDTQQRVVIAVYRISCCKRGRELLLEEGAPESLIRLISKPNEEMRKVRIDLVRKSRRSNSFSSNPHHVTPVFLGPSTRDARPLSSIWPRTPGGRSR